MPKKYNKKSVFICGGQKYHLDSSSTIKIRKASGLSNPLILCLEAKFPENFFKNKIFSYEDVKVPKGSSTDKELSKLSNYLVVQKQDTNEEANVNLSNGEFTIQENIDGVLFVTLQFEIPGDKMQRGKMQNGKIE